MNFAKPRFRKYKKQVFERAGLVGQFVYQIGEDERLRIPSKEVPLNKIKTADYQAKFKYIKNSLKRYRKLTGYGRGITAIQLGIHERFSVIYVPKEYSTFSSQSSDIKNELLVIINPKITKKSTRKYLYSEMCMSANPIVAAVIRPVWIEFEYYDDKGEKKFWNTKNDTDLGKMMNRVFQHEIDHMEGVINIDKVDPKTLILESDPKYYETAKFIDV